MTAPIHLSLPEPPAQTGSRQSRNWRSEWSEKHRTKQRVWAAAIQQVKPLAEPPEAVRVDAHFRLHSRRDPANLYGDLKPVLDALKRTPAPSDKLRWKQGLYLMRGYFEDDDRLEFGEVTQEISRDDRGLELTITPISEAGSERTGG